MTPKDPLDLSQLDRAAIEKLDREELVELSCRLLTRRSVWDRALPVSADR